MPYASMINAGNDLSVLWSVLALYYRHTELTDQTEHTTPQTYSGHALIHFAT